LRERVVARRYAKALLEIGRREERIGEIHGELVQVQALFKDHPEFWKAVSLPIYPMENRRAVLKKVLERIGFSGSIVRFFEILVEKDRIGLTPTIFSIFQELADKAQNRARGVLYSPEPLEEGDFEKVKEALSGYMGKEILLEKDVDPSLIGGFMARIGGIVIDGSVKGQLDRYREKLLTA